MRRGSSRDLGEGVEFSGAHMDRIAEPAIERRESVRDRVAAHLRVPLFRTTYALTLSAALTSALGMAYWIFAARLYPTQDVGKSSAVISAVAFLQVVASLSLDGMLMRFVPRAGHGTARLVAASLAMCSLVGVAASVVFLATIIGRIPSLGFLLSNNWLAVGFVLLTVSSGNFLLQDGALTGLRQAPWVLVKNGTFSALKIVLLVPLATWFSNYGILVSWSVAMLILLIPTNAFLFLRLIPRHAHTMAHLHEHVHLRGLSRYVAGNYVAALFNVGAVSLMPIAVLHQAGSVASAHFYLPWLIATTLRLVPVNMSMSLVVEGAIDSQRLGYFGRHALVHSGRLLLPVILVLVVGAPYILGFFGQGYARDGVPLLRLLAISAIPSIVVVLYLGLARVQQRIGGIILLQGILTVVSLAASYLVLPVYGITGVGVVWLVLQTTAATVLLITRLRPLLSTRGSIDPGYRG